MDNPKQDDLNPKGFSLTPEQLKELQERWNKPKEQNQALSDAAPLDAETLEQPDPQLKDNLIRQRIIQILDQRNEQRKKIFDLAKAYCWASFLLLVVIVYFQIALRLAFPGEKLNVFDGNELEVLVVGVFGQFVGLLYIITKSLYDDTNYKDLFKDGMDKH